MLSNKRNVDQKEPHGPNEYVQVYKIVFTSWTHLAQSLKTSFGLDRFNTLIRDYSSSTKLGLKSFDSHKKVA